MTEKEIILYRKMTSAKYDGKTLKYWWYKRKYKKLIRRNEKWKNLKK